MAGRALRAHKTRPMTVLAAKQTVKQAARRQAQSARLANKTNRLVAPGRLPDWRC